MSKKHIVQQGECLSRIAKAHGFVNWRTIYEHADNSELRKKRPNPNILFPGDEVSIPDPKQKTEKAATGSRHVFVVSRLQKQLRVVFKTPRGELFGDEPYLIRFDSGRMKEGRTDSGGLLKELVEWQESSATIVITGRVLRLLLGHLNPTGDVEHEDLSGVQARLNNLGYTAGPNDGIYGRNTRAALALLQADQQLEVNGLPDEPTLAKLVELHGC
jgi:N-acetylmuramoyl-L-alanine amidase